MASQRSMHHNRHAITVAASAFLLPRGPPCHFVMPGVESRVGSPLRRTPAADWCGRPHTVTSGNRTAG